MEEIIFKIILHSGNARTKLINSLKSIKNFDFEQSKKLQKEAIEELNLAHMVQTKIINEEVNGKKQDVNLLMVHAQDHLSGAITLKDTVKEISEIFEILDERIGELEK